MLAQHESPRKKASPHAVDHHDGLRSSRHGSLLAKMAKTNVKKRRVRVNRVKGIASRGLFRRSKWIWVVLVVLLFVPLLSLT